MYPAFVGSIVLLVTFFLMIYLVPQMTGFIRNMGQEMPLQTRILMAVSNFFVNYWWAVLAAPFVAWFGLKLAIRTNPAVRVRGRPLQDLDAADRPDPAQDHPVALRLELRHDVQLGHHRARRDPQLRGDRRQPCRWRARCARAGQQIAEGKNMTAAFQDLELFPPLVIRMLRIGEATGALDTALLNVSYFYNREVRESIAKVQAMIEPAAHRGAGRDPRLGDAVGARAGLRRHLQDEVLTMAARAPPLLHRRGPLPLHGGAAASSSSRPSSPATTSASTRSASTCAGGAGALFAVLADLAGEDFHEEQVPLAARQRPRGGGAAPPRPALPRHAPRRGAVARPVRTPQRRNERLLLDLVHQYRSSSRPGSTRSRKPAPASPACTPCRCSRRCSPPASACAARARWWSPPTAPACASASSTDGKLRFARLERTVEMVRRRRWRRSCARRRCAWPST